MPELQSLQKVNYPALPEIKKTSTITKLATGAGRILPGVLGGALGLVGTLLQNKANKKLAKYSFDRNKEMWRLQNEYNAPKQQMSRLQEAGLNPNLMYGKGTVGNAQTMPQYQALPTSGDTFGKGIESVSNLLGVAMQEEQLKGKAIETWILENARTIRLQKEGYETIEAFNRSQISMWTALGKEYEQRITEIKKNYWEKGINPNDAMWLRIGVKAIEQLNAPQWIKDIFNDLPIQIKQAVNDK
jgi:hypothetical protein